MTKLRVYEYAKQLNMSSKEIITILSRLDIPVNNHMSVMEDKMVSAVEGFFSDVKARAAARTVAEQERVQVLETAKRKALQAKEMEKEANNTGIEAANKESVLEQTETITTRVAMRSSTTPAHQGKEQEVVAQEVVAQAASRPRNETANSNVSDVTTQVETTTPGKAHAVDDDASPITGARSTQSALAPSSRNTSGPSSSSQQRRPYAGSRSEGGNTGRSDAGGQDRPRPSSDRPQSNRPYGDRPQSSRPPGDRPQSNRPPGDRPAGGYSRPPRSSEGTSSTGGSGGVGGSSSRPPSSGYAGRSSQAGPGRSSGGYQGNRPAGSSGDNGYRSSSSGASSTRPSSAGGYRPSARPDSSGGSGRDDRPGTSAGGRSNDRRPAASAPRTDRNRATRESAAPASTTGAPRFGDSRSSATAGRKRPGERPTGTRDVSSDKRENNRKLQQPRGRQRGRVEQPVRVAEGPRRVTVDGPMVVVEFAHLIRREASEVIKKLLFLGTLVTINQEIDTDAMVLVGGEFGTEVIVEAPRDIEAEEMLIEATDEDSMEHRAPVVTIMGHVDHGKTTLLDAIRETNVTASEAGGITQHIGAYQVEINHKKITFLDTPGHAAFTTMRARGAQITDITVLVVAADDGVMPQTVEAIHHAKAANVPIIVAVNKIDKPGANVDRIKQELTEHGLVAEEWGGDTIFVPMSAKQKQGIEELLEMILLVAEVADLKASLTMRARGSVIEAELDKGRGPVATVLVQNGSLHIGDMVVAGKTFGRIRAMVNDRGRRVKEALPSTPVEIVGLSDVPNAGDLFVVYDDERQARVVSERRTSRRRVEDLGETSRVTLDDLYKQIQEGQIKDLNIILKADVHGSAEAVLGSLQKIDISGVRVVVIHSGVGAITESDVLLASASNAVVVGFNVRPDPNAMRMADEAKVEVRLYRVIYSLIEEIEAALKGMLDPVLKEVVLGRAEVRQLFKVSKVGTIAGGFVLDGKLVRDADIRLIRNGVVVHEGKLDSLKRFKDDAKEVASGYECGFTLDHFNDMKEGDIIEAFTMEAVKAD